MAKRAIGGTLYYRGGVNKMLIEERWTGSRGKIEQVRRMDWDDVCRQRSGICLAGQGK